MEVILLETIEGLGKAGAVVKVRDGFGRNFLLPHHRALPADAGNMYRLKSLQARFAIEEARRLEEVRGVAALLEGKVVNLLAKSTDEGHLFGSVTPAMICEQLREQGFEQLTDRHIRLAEPIRSVGTFPVTVHLHADVDVSITVVVDAVDGNVVMPGSEPAEEEAAGEISADAEGSTTEESGEEAEAGS